MAALARKRPSPLLTGREPSWCAGVVHAIGAANFLLDASQSPHCSAATIADHFGVATSTSQNHARKVRDLLKITPFSPRWCLPSLHESSEIPWIVEVDGFLHDTRSLPIEIQAEACAKGWPLRFSPGLESYQLGARMEGGCWSSHRADSRWHTLLQMNALMSRLRAERP